MNAQVETSSEGQDGSVPKPKSPVEVVTLSDGRQVEFVGKRKLLKESVVAEDGGIFVRLDFRNGETRTFKIPDALIAKFAAHGAEQKLGDETAGTDDVDDMVLDIDELIARLEKGEWSIKREGGNNAGTSVLMKALMVHGQRTAEQVKAFLTGKTQAEKLALRNHPKIKPIVEEIEAQKQAKGAKVDTEALLSAL